MPHLMNGCTENACDRVERENAPDKRLNQPVHNQDDQGRHQEYVGQVLYDQLPV
ncbi:hypothetical protein D3C84_1023080 [compost metagenome]